MSDESVVIHGRQFLMFQSCIEHQIHLSAHHFVKGLNKSSDAALRKRLHGHPSRSMHFDSDNSDSDEDFIDTSMAPANPENQEEVNEVEFNAGDVIGKVLALVKQVNALRLCQALVHSGAFGAGSDEPRRVRSKTELLRKYERSP